MAATSLAHAHAPPMPAIADRLLPRVVEAEGASIAPGALLVAGFPTFGLVGSIVAGYLVASLRMEQIGRVEAATLLPAVVVEDGRAHAPVRLFSSPIVCGPGGKCDQLVVVESELQPPPYLLAPMAEALLDWAQGRAISLVLAVEGVPPDAGAPAAPEIAGMANDAGLSTLDYLRLARITGVATGFTAALLLAGMRPASRLPVVCALSRARPEFPDAHAAAAIIERLRPLVPSLDVDTAPLRETAGEIEKAARARRDEHAASVDRLTDGGSVSMYG